MSSLLNALHQGVQVVYGTEIFDRDTAGGYVLLPGVVQSKDTGELCIALLELDLQSSGEHCATDFLIRYGCISQSEQEMPDDVRKFLRETYGAYDYGYTATLTDDIHVDKSSLPPEMRRCWNILENTNLSPMTPNTISKAQKPRQKMRGNWSTDEKQCKTACLSSCDLVE